MAVDGSSAATKATVTVLVMVDNSTHVPTTSGPTACAVIQHQCKVARRMPPCKTAWEAMNALCTAEGVGAEVITLTI